MNDLHIVHSKAGVVQVIPAAMEGLEEHGVQGKIRSTTDAFLAKKVVVCEGATEVGFLRGFDDYQLENARDPLAYHGVALLDARGGGNVKAMAKAFKSLCYDVSVLADGDAEHQFSPADEAELRGLGISVIAWSEKLYLEGRAFHDLPWGYVIASLKLARDELGYPLRDQVLAKFTGQLDQDFGAWIDTVELRTAIGTAANKSHWFGAVHAGKVDPLQAASSSAKIKITRHPDQGTRCTRGCRSNLRLIHASGDICVSCWNRQREWTLGRNARGTEPKTFVPLQSRRVGIVVDGERCYRLVVQTQNDAEPLARCIREMPEGIAFHDEPPGVATWNKQALCFEYRDRVDPSRVLLELKDGNRLHFVSVKANSLRQGEVAAIPRMPTVRMSVHTAAVWFDLDQDGDGVAVTSEWRPQAMACSSCCIAQIQARRFSGVVECRCPACGSSSTGRSRRANIRASVILTAARGARSV